MCYHVSSTRVRVLVIILVVIVDSLLPDNLKTGPHYSLISSVVYSRVCVFGETLLATERGAKQEMVQVLILKQSFRLPQSASKPLKADPILDPVMLLCQLLS